MNKNERKKGSPSLEPAIQYIQIIDRKKAQNLSILLRALNVTTEEVAEALQEGECVYLPPLSITPSLPPSLLGEYIYQHPVNTN